jgi:hypothetical protein
VGTALRIVRAAGRLKQFRHSRFCGLGPDIQGPCARQCTCAWEQRVCSAALTELCTSRQECADNSWRWCTILTGVPLLVPGVPFQNDVRDTSTPLYATPVCNLCCLVWLLRTLCVRQQVSASAALDQQLPYIASSGDSAAPAADLGELLAAARQHWKAVRGQRKRVWGEWHMRHMLCTCLRCLSHGRVQCMCLSCGSHVFCVGGV